MEPSPQLVLSTTTKINKYLQSKGQTETYIAETWVYRELKSHLGYSWENGLLMSDNEISDRVTTIAVRKLNANILAAKRYQKDEQLLSRPFDDQPTDFSKQTIADIPSRGEVAYREQKYNGILPDRFLNLND